MYHDIFGLPRLMDNVGYIYPVKMKDYLGFCNYSWILRYEKAHTYVKSEEISNFEAIIYRNFRCDLLEGFEGNNLIKVKIYAIGQIIKIVLKEEPRFDFEKNEFLLSNNRKINKNNYDEFRSIVMEQNLIMKEKIYKSKELEQWFEKAKKTKEKENKNSNVDFEDIVSTIKNKTGCTYDELLNETYYQLITDFMRVIEISNHEDAVIFASQVGTDKIKIEPISKKIKLMQEDPDESLKKKFNSLL